MELRSIVESVPKISIPPFVGRRLELRLPGDDQRDGEAGTGDGAYTARKVTI